MKHATTKIGLFAGFALALFMGGCSGLGGGGEEVIGHVEVPGPNNTTILIPVTASANNGATPIAEAARDANITRQRTNQLMDDLATGRKTPATLTAADKDLLKVVLTAEKMRKDKRR